MTWRSLQYFIGDSRDLVARVFARVCCGRDDENDGNGGVKPDLHYTPGKYSNIVTADLIDEYQLKEAFVGRPPKSPTDIKKKIAVNDLSEADAKKTLLGNGIEIAATIDVDDEMAFKTIEEKSIGISAADQLTSAEMVRPGDKVGLLLQDGVARGYVLLEKGSGKLPFPTKTALISKQDELKAKELITSTNTARGELTDLNTMREALSADVTRLKADVDVLNAVKEKSAAEVKLVETQLAELAKARAAITKEIETVNTELASAEENRKAILIAVREGQPVTILTGTKDPAMIARLAEVGVFTVKDFANLTAAQIRKFSAAGVFKVTEANKIKKDAINFINR
jgi:predicted flap endonuclease-1-like 5' DNA nuclease